MPNKLQEYRENCGLTQQFVADSIGTTPVSVSVWENTNRLPRKRFREALANLYGCFEEDLFGAEADHPKPGRPSSTELIESVLNRLESIELMLAHFVRIYSQNEWIKGSIDDEDSVKMLDVLFNGAALNIDELLLKARTIKEKREEESK